MKFDLKFLVGYQAVFTTISVEMNVRLTLALSFLILTAAPPRLGFTTDADIPYTVRVPYRVVRGVTNIALGWTEILLRPIGERKTESIPEALGIAFANTATRAAFGGRDIFMCWVADMQMEEVYPDWQTWPYLFHWS